MRETYLQLYYPSGAVLNVRTGDKPIVAREVTFMIRTLRLLRDQLTDQEADLSRSMVAGDIGLEPDQAWKIAR